MKKRIVSLILTAILLISTLSAVPAFASTAWNGTDKQQPNCVDGVYQIGNGAELAWFSDYTKTNGNVNAVLTDDIDLNSKEWYPIGKPESGYVTEAYSGIFDGKNHTVSGLSINTSAAFYGLFWCVYGGSVKNLKVEGNVSTTGSSAGGIVGKLQGGTIENCSFAGSVSAKRNYVGGIVGNVLTNSKVASSVISCSNSAAVTGATAGGIIGDTTAKVNVKYCYNTGTISGTSRSGGITGRQTAGTLAYCYNIGESKCGVSGFTNAAVTNCYYLTQTATPGGTSADKFVQITDKDTLLSNLNAGETHAFVADTKNKNNGYPILTWQNTKTPEEEAAEAKKKEDAKKVKTAVDKLSLDYSTVKEECTLDLPKEYNECNLVWKSSNAEIISDKGKVTLPDKNIVTVTLTATITRGEAVGTKEFNINVWSKNIDPDVYLRAVLDSMEWSFSSLQPKYGVDSNVITKLNTVLKNKGFDGITVTVKSTDDESLVSSNGKIFFPQIDENSFAQGKQVKVFFNLTFEGKTVTYPETDNYALLIPWNTDSVKTALETSAKEQLDANVIKDGNESLDNVTSNLTLPSNLNRYGGKYNYATVTWQSSDPSHLEISDDLRKGGADAFYNPYLGKVYRDKQEHTVTLIALITNPSTDVSITRTYTVTISPLSDSELNQSLDKMNAVLSCYTADKLTDMASKKKLDTSAVDNDIQLVIPKNVVTKSELSAINYGKYWDYWNYKFSVTSSDTDVIEINSFRGYVYRPLGESYSADKKVTLTVRMTSKENPNLYVTKNIDVTVKHLTREEINAQLALMDKAKENYASGLLGDNSDIYSVIDSLSPYSEIVWNSDKSSVDFVRNHSDIQGTGIKVDELPGWESQEDWRLFHTSNKDLLSNETLILNETPNDDTFVKINSVLSDESLGKYYNKFKDAKNFDKEALAKFKQLYKQPVSAYLLVLGKNNYTDNYAEMSVETKAQLFSSKLASFKLENDKPISVTFSLLGLDGKTLISKVNVDSFTKGATVFDVFKKMIADNNMYFSAVGSYVSSINNLSEKQYGPNSGWMYSVDGVFVNSYMNAQELNGNENIVVMYVRDYTKANTSMVDDSKNNGSGNGSNSGSSNSGDNSSASNSKGNSSSSSKSSSKKASEQNKAKTAASKDKSEKTEDKSDSSNDSKDAEDSNDASPKSASADGSVMSAQEENAQTQSKNNTKNIIIIAVCAVIVLLLVLALILFARKKRKQD